MFVEWKHEGKISFSFFSPSMLIGKYVQNVVISLFSFWVLLFCWVLYMYISSYIQQRIFCMLPLHNFLVYFFFCPKEERTGKRRGRGLTIPSGFFLIACCSTDDLFLIIEIGCLRALTRTFFSFSCPRWDIYAYSERKIVVRVL